MTFGAARYPEGVLRKFAFAEKPLSVYEERFTIEVPVSWTGGPPALSGTVEYQACNDRQCNPPASVAFRAAAPSAPSGAALPGGAVALSAAPKGAAAATAAPGAANDFGALLERKGLLGALLVVFGWGLLLNLTPCVYPVIPLTVGFFGGQAAGQSRRLFGLAAVYVLGMATTYSALGVAAALSGKLFGSALQSPWVLVGVAAVLTALALSMFGLYDIRMPTSWMQKAGARAGGAGAYAMGLLVGVVAAPCIGPVVLALLAFVAARQDAAFGFLIFFVLSLGLGLPYLFLAAFLGQPLAPASRGRVDGGSQEDLRMGAPRHGGVLPAHGRSGAALPVAPARGARGRSDRCGLRKRTRAPGGDPGNGGSCDWLARPSSSLHGERRPPTGQPGARTPRRPSPRRRAPR